MAVLVVTEVVYTYDGFEQFLKLMGVFTSKLMVLFQPVIYWVDSVVVDLKPSPKGLSKDGVNRA